MANPRDPYEVLGVPRSATDDEIRRAFHKLAHKYHPDKTGGNKEADEKMKEVNAAYDILKNPERRSKYDQFGHMGEGFGGAPGGFTGGFGGAPGGFESPFEDLFDMFFGRGGGPRTSRPRAAPGSDLEYRIAITLKEAAFGAKKTIRFTRMEQCNSCSGTGAAAGTRPEVCAQCQGSGQVRMAQGFFSVTQTCPKCRGSGHVITKPCSRCSGSGHVRADRELAIDIPPGVATGSRLRIPGEGEPGDHGGARGDLYILIEVRRHDIFTRDGNDVICEIPVKFIHAALGTTIRVPTLNGEADLKIAPGTQSGTLLRLRGQGLPDLRGYRQGDQIVRVVVEVPTKLSRKQKELLKQFEANSDTKTYPLHRRFMERLKNAKAD